MLSTLHKKWLSQFQCQQIPQLFLRLILMSLTKGMKIKLDRTSDNLGEREGEACRKGALTHTTPTHLLAKREMKVYKKQLVMAYKSTIYTTQTIKYLYSSGI